MSASLTLLIEVYIEKTLRQSADALEIAEWRVRRLVWSIWSLVLTRALNKSIQTSPGIAGAVSRGELRTIMLNDTGSFDDRAVDVLVSAGLLASDGAYVWHANDLVLEYGIAKVILQRYFPQDASARWASFMRDLGMSREWLPGQMGILAFVAVELAIRGVFMWEYATEDFNGRKDWLNMLSLLLPTELTDLNFVVQILQANAKSLRLSREKLASGEHSLLGMFVGPAERSDDSNQNATPGHTAIDLVPQLTVPRRELRRQLFQVHASSGTLGRLNKLDEIPDPLKPDFDFWSTHFPSVIVPLLGRTETPVATRMYLVDRIALLCADLRLPVEINARIYESYANAARSAGVKLSPEMRMKILISEDETCVREVLEIMINCIATSDFVSMDFVPGGDGSKALEMLKQSRYSLFLIDEMHPGLSGCDVVRLYRKWIENSHHEDDLNIVFLTGSYDISDSAQDVGCDGYLHKPFTLEALYEIVFGYGGRDYVHLAALRDALIGIIGNT